MHLHLEIDESLCEEGRFSVASGCTCGHYKVDHCLGSLLHKTFTELSGETHPRRTKNTVKVIPHEKTDNVIADSIIIRFIPPQDDTGERSGNIYAIIIVLELDTAMTLLFAEPSQQHSAPAVNTPSSTPSAFRSSDHFFETALDAYLYELFMTLLAVEYEGISPNVLTNEGFLQCVPPSVNFVLVRNSTVTQSKSAMSKTVFHTPEVSSNKKNALRNNYKHQDELLLHAALCTAPLRLQTHFTTASECESDAKMWCHTGISDRAVNLSDILRIGFVEIVPHGLAAADTIHACIFWCLDNGGKEMLSNTPVMKNIHNVDYNNRTRINDDNNDRGRCASPGPYLGDTLTSEKLLQYFAESGDGHHLSTVERIKRRDSEDSVDCSRESSLALSQSVPNQYSSASNKIDTNWENGYLAMLKSMVGITERKARAVATVYPTFNSLLQDARGALLTEDNDGTLQRLSQAKEPTSDRVLGIRSARHIIESLQAAYDPSRMF